MAEQLPLEIPDSPKFAENIIHFARALRKAGLPVGPGRTKDAVRAVAAAGFSDKADFYWTLHACFVSRPEQKIIFAQVFRLFWRDPRYLEHMMAMMLPAVRGVQEEKMANAGEKRAAEALLDDQIPEMPEQEQNEEETMIEIDSSFTMSKSEKLKTLDFEQMSTDEITQAKAMLARMRLPVDPLKSRRHIATPLKARVDQSATLRAAMRSGGDIRDLKFSTPRLRWPNLIVLCDISGSMSQYSRMVLHFLHAVMNTKGQGWAKVYAFTFGTRLTNISRHLRQKDVDAALAAAGAEAQDWEGGTRIAGCLHAFNRDWSRRVLGQGAVVLLITDGLDRDDDHDLAHEMRRLHLSAKRLIWLNPLLRYDGFMPQATGIRAMMPHVDSFRAGHSVQTLEDLAEAISRREDLGQKARMLEMMRQ
jgi:uncharacterized protein with von Willebrand factor type A (vWA) domain